MFLILTKTSVLFPSNPPINNKNYLPGESPQWKIPLKEWFKRIRQSLQISMNRLLKRINFDRDSLCSVCDLTNYPIIKNLSNSICVNINRLIKIVRILIQKLYNLGLNRCWLTTFLSKHKINHKLKFWLHFPMKKNFSSSLTYPNHPKTINMNW